MMRINILCTLIIVVWFNWELVVKDLQFIDWLLFIAAGGVRGGGSNAYDVGDLQFVPEQLTSSQSKPHLHDALPASTVHWTVVTQHVSGHCHQH